jgi:hypothetical protein
MSDHVNLVKLCVGVESFEDLDRHINAAPGSATGHVTRMRPKKEAELVAGGSLYWVIKGVIQARQEVLALEKYISGDGIKRCEIVLAKPLIRTQNAPRRAFQGWRYLKPEDAPADMPAGREHEEDLPPELAQALADIGVF